MAKTPAMDLRKAIGHPWLLLILLILSIGLGRPSPDGSTSSSPDSCLVGETSVDDFDSSLRAMEYSLGGDVRGTFLAYVQPNASSFYNKDARHNAPFEPGFPGRTGKFINLSNNTVRLFVYPPVKGATEDILLREFSPWSAHFLTCYPDQQFYFAPIDKTEHLISWKMDISSNNRLHVYDPYTGPDSLHGLDAEERSKYERFKETLEFHKQYETFTARSYLPNAIRSRVTHPMFKAEYFGQEHTVETRETHFVQAPPLHALEPIFESGRARVLGEDEPRLLSGYRTPGQSTMNMTLTVLSVAPRVFEIQNFLSPVEVDHVVSLGSARVLQQSKQGGDGKSRDSQDARTSKNMWVKREQSQIIDTIYRRAADLLRIDEGLLRSRDKTEHPDVSGTKSIAESLQLVHYAEGEHYATHQIDRRLQANRFATLLLYLNDGMVGGDTSFPLWANAETPEGLNVVPEVGKAILFYSLLPDGNMDERSIHSAKPVSEGEKWIANLWVWDPILET